MTRAFLALGANLGDPVAQIREAARQLAAQPGIADFRLSPVYFSDPVGITDQPRFANAAASLLTELPPQTLLATCLAVEQRLGRTRTIRWGPRIIDVDLILFGDRQSDDPELTLPHPRWQQRSFVVRPIFDLAPDLVVNGLPVRELLGRLDCSDLQRIEF